MRKFTNVWCNDTIYPREYTTLYLIHKDILIKDLIYNIKIFLFNTCKYINNIHNYGYRATNPTDPDVTSQGSILTLRYDIRRIPRTTKKPTEHYFQWFLSFYKEELIGIPTSMSLERNTLTINIDFKNLLEEAEAGLRKLEREQEQKAEKERQRKREIERCLQIQKQEEELRRRQAQLRRQQNEERERRMEEARRQNERLEIYENLYNPMNEIYAAERELERVYRICEHYGH